jgi:hypothetical protein
MVVLSQEVMTFFAHSHLLKRSIFEFLLKTNKSKEIKRRDSGEEELSSSYNFL